MNDSVFFGLRALFALSLVRWMFVLRWLSGLVDKMNPLHKVDLSNPELSIIIEIIKSVCCVSVVTDYMLFRKYNLQEVAKEPTNQSAGPQEAVKEPTNQSASPQEAANQTQEHECGETAEGGDVSTGNGSEEAELE